MGKDSICCPSGVERTDESDWGFGRPLLKNPWFYFAVVCVLAITLTRPLLRKVPEPLPVLRDVPRFELIDQNGQLFSSEALLGTPYVASFIFTRCVSICPLVAQKVKDLQGQLRDGGLPVRLVSFTVDPEFDRPEQLKAFGERYSALPEVWSFLTSVPGDGENHLAFIERAFGVGVEGVSDGDGQSALEIAHSEKLVLVDQFGRLRGYFASTADGIEEIFHRSVAVLGEREPVPGP
jgi:protein SCO1/2